MISSLTESFFLVTEKQHEDPSGFQTAYNIEIKSYLVLDVHHVFNSFEHDSTTLN